MKIFILLLTFCLVQAGLPNALIGKLGDMKVSVIALESENTWALVIPSEKQPEYISKHMLPSDIQRIVGAFDPDKITTYLLLFPHDSPQASLNVALGGEPLTEFDYFAVHYQREGKEWLPKLMGWENVKNDTWKAIEEIYTFDGHVYENKSSSQSLTNFAQNLAGKTFTHNMIQTNPQKPFNPSAISNVICLRGGSEKTTIKAAFEENTGLREEVATIVFREMQTRVYLGSASASHWGCCVSIAPFVTFNPKYAKYTAEEKLKLVHESIMAGLKKGDPGNLLGYQLPKAIQLPEVSLGKHEMKVSVILLGNPTTRACTQALVIPSTVRTWFVKKYMSSAQVKHIAETFDPEKITTYSLLFPHDSRQAELNVKLGGEPLGKQDYFAVHYQKEGAIWLPKFMMWENTTGATFGQPSYTYHGQTYTFNGHTYNDLGPDLSFGKSFTNRMVPPGTRSNCPTDNIHVRGNSETIVQTSHQQTTGHTEEIARVALREMQTNFTFSTRGTLYEEHFNYVISIVPFVTFSQNYAGLSAENKLKLVKESIMAIIEKHDPEDLLGYRAAARIPALETTQTHPRALSFCRD
jgi:hypothetical protein